MTDAEPQPRSPQLASAARVVLDAILHHPQPGADLSEAAVRLGEALDDHDRRHPLLPTPAEADR